MSDHTPPEAAAGTAPPGDVTIETLTIHTEDGLALEAEIALLIGRRKAIVAQLGELSALAGSSAVDYGDGEPPQ